MKKVLQYKTYFLAIISGVLIRTALPGYNIYPLAFIAFVPLFFALDNKSLKQSVTVTFTYGLITGIICYYWIIDSAAEYSNYVTGQSMLTYSGLCLYYALWYGITGAGYYAVSKIKDKNWLFIISCAALFTTIEWIFQSILPSFCWMIPISLTQGSNLWLLQWTSVFGMWFMTFFIIGINTIVFIWLHERQIKFLIASLIILAAVHLSGYLILISVTEQSPSSIKIAIIQENVEAEERWNDVYADTIAHRLINLNRKAASFNPDIILWSETAIPWTFSEDDDLLNIVLNSTYRSKASHIVGMFTSAGSKGEVYNSLYYIEPDGKITNRYDKQELLLFLEQPLFSFALPFQQSRYSNILPGKRANVMHTEYGKIGTIICNETLMPYAAANALKKGAEMITVSGNSAWFNYAPVSEAHIASVRMRAIETRKDIVINLNMGRSGIIRASGKAELFAPSHLPRCKYAAANLNNRITLAGLIPDLSAYFSIIILLLTFLVKSFRKKGEKK